MSDPFSEMFGNFFSSFMPAPAQEPAQQQGPSAMDLMFQHGFGADWMMNQDVYYGATTKEDLIRRGGPRDNPLPSAYQNQSYSEPAASEPPASYGPPAPPAPTQVVQDIPAMPEGSQPDYPTMPEGSGEFTPISPPVPDMPEGSGVMKPPAPVPNEIPADGRPPRYPPNISSVAPTAPPNLVKAVERSFSPLPQQPIPQTPPGIVAAVTDQSERTWTSSGYGEQVTGRITVNGRTYQFVNGGSGRGSIPFGEYTVGRFTSGEQRAQEGFSYTRDAFELNNVKDNSPAASRQDDRRGLLIHDGNRGITAGCIGIKGDFKQFTTDLQAEIAKTGGVKIRLGPPQSFDSGAMKLGGPTDAVTREVQARLSAYSPQGNGDQMEGGYNSARPGPGDDPKNWKTWTVKTIEDVVAGKSDYVTLAGNPKFEGKAYKIPELPYVDKDGKVHILKDVKAVVHDTGAAFDGSGSAKRGWNKPAPEGRFDLAIAKDATDEQMNANHAKWKELGLKILAQGD